jgi:hypothetical protein
MKKLMMLALVALLSFGVASVSWAQDAAGGQPAGGATTSGKTEKKHKSKHKKSKKSKTPAAAQQ